MQEMVGKCLQKYDFMLRGSYRLSYCLLRQTDCSRNGIIVFFLEIYQKCAMINAKWRTVGETNDTG